MADGTDFCDFRVFSGTLCRDAAWHARISPATAHRPASTETVGQPRGHAMILAQVAQTLPDVAQSVPPLTSSDLSIFGLFWSAHIVVKVVMIGLLVSSIWVWAIVLDKTFLY